MGMNVRGTVRHRVRNAHMTFQPLMHVPSLSDINRNPTPVFALPRINVVAGQRTKSSVNRIDLVLILLSRLAGPRDAGRRFALLFVAVTE